MTSCARPGCAESAKTRGLCESHYRKLLRMGRAGYVPAAPVRAHLESLRTLGWTWEQIAEQAGTSTWVPHKVGTGYTRRVLMDRAQALLSVPLVPRDSHRGVDPTGTRRRVQALAWMGWPCREVAARAGTTQPSLSTLIQSRRRISYRLALRVVHVYDELSSTPGPSHIAASKARAAGFAPPAAWDEETIDDPAALPDFGVDARTTSADRASEARFLLSCGLSISEVAQRLGVKPPWVQTVARRAGAA
jgi:plasmid maintenance system antidote protein VapI